ncbi:MAG: hypothetical protein HYV63_16105 [Candidatus Schekmanbacteria bacterium]|nr:hypothetical protein [Candidatus Schekmanbacteria bacterium]
MHRREGTSLGFSVALILILSGMILGCGDLADEFKSRALIREGKELYQKEEYADACSRFEEALTMRAADLQLKQSLAYCYTALYDPAGTTPENAALTDKAAALLREVLAATPDNAKLREAVLGLYVNANRHRDAIAFLEGVLQQAPQQVEVAKQIATLYAEIKDFDKAYEWYYKWGSMDPTNPDPWFTIAFLAWKRAYCDLVSGRCEEPTFSTKDRAGQVEAGMKAALKGLEVDTNHAELCAYLNLLYLEKAKWIDVGDAAKIRVDRQEAAKYRERAVQLFEERKKKQALELEQAAASGTPGAAGELSPELQNALSDATPAGNGAGEASPAAGEATPAGKDGSAKEKVGNAGQ